MTMLRGIDSSLSSKCCSAVVGDSIYAHLARQIPMLQYVNSYKDISKIITGFGSEMRKDNYTSNCKVTVRDSKLDVTPSKFSAPTGCSAAPQPVTHDVISCSSRSFISSAYRLGVMGAQQECNRFETGQSIYNKSLSHIIHDIMPITMQSAFFEGLYSGVYEEVACNVEKETPYDKYVALDSAKFDFGASGIKLKDLMTMLSKYSMSTGMAFPFGTKLVMLMDSYNYNILQESVQDKIIGTIGGSIKLGDDLLNVFDFQAATGILKLPHTSVQIIPVNDDGLFKRNSKGQPIMPVYNPSMIGFDITPLYMGNTLSSMDAQLLAKYTHLNLGNGFSGALYTSADDPDLTPSFKMSLYFRLMFIKLFKEGQFFVLGKAAT